MKKIFLGLCLMLFVVGLLVAAGQDEAIDIEKEVINIWTPTGSNDLWIQQLIEEYNTIDPNVEFIQTVQSFSDYFTVLNTAIGSDDTPDIMWSTIAAYKRYVEADVYAELNDYYSKYGWELIVGTENLLSLEVNSNSYVLPVETPFWPVFYYNKVIFAELGLTPPETEAEFVTVAKALVDGGYLPVVAGNKDFYIANILYNGIAANMISEEEVRNVWQKGYQNVDFTSSQQIEILEKLKYFTDNIWVEGANAMSIADSETLFAGYRAGALMKDSYLLAKTRVASQFDNPAEEVGIFYLPTFNQVDPPAIAYQLNGMYALSSSSQHKETGAEFLNYLISADGQSLGAINGIMPIRNDVVLNDEGGPVMMAAFEAAKGRNRVLSPTAGFPNDFAREMQVIFQELIGGRLTPEEAALAIEGAK